MITYEKRLENIKRHHEANEISKIEYNIKKMFDDKIIKIVCNVDTREQLPYSESEINMPTISIKNDVGDYQFIAIVERGGEEGIKQVHLGLVIERKTISDFYSTLFVSKNCERFYREIQRANEDKRITDFFIFVEGSQDDYLRYVIPQKRQFMAYEIKKTSSARRGKLASLEMRGARVCFKNSRANSCSDLKPYAEQWLLKNYVKVFCL